MFGEVFLTYWAGLGIILSLLFLNFMLNFMMMLLIKRDLGYKSKFSKQSFIKRLFLLNNPNIPNKAFVIITYINYVIFALLVISYICHITIYKQLSSTILQIFGYLALISLAIMWMVGAYSKNKYD